MLCAFDLETTGVDTREARIVTGYVATVRSRADGRGIEVGAQVLVNPGVPIPDGAAKIHGVTDEIAQTKGCDPLDGVNSLAEAVSRSLLARIPVIGHNVGFDLALLHWECIRHDLPTVSERMGLSRDAMVGPIIDVLVLDKQVDRYRPGSRKLDDSKGPGVATHYGVPLTAAHQADADAIAALRVAVVIADRHPGIGTTTPVELHRAQRMWKAEQAASLQAHFRKTKPQAYVDGCWPFCVDLSHPTT